MWKTCLFVFALTLLPVLVNAKNQNRSCGLAYQMQQSELPRDIAVKVDSMTGGATRIAMDWWVARLSRPARPTKWHTVERLDDCMIYIRHGWDNMMSKRSAAGYTRMPDDERYDGIATVKLLDAWVVAHEIGHLIGCRHGSGVMRADYTSQDEQLWIDNDALHFALLVRIKVEAARIPQSWRTDVRPSGPGSYGSRNRLPSASP
jgi:hypothetical protein